MRDREREVEKTPAATTRELRPYRSPRLTAHGDVRGITMGGSPGTGDSGAYYVQQSA